ncbi:MAG: PAS domain S-box protein, partial [Gammaproteobacteria bacterium]|nr:PAS domain S-box protein [Gammaproteobacteria bacterium]
MSFKLKTILGIALIEIVLLTVLIASVLNFIYSSNKKQINSYASTTIRLFLNATKSAVLASDLASLDSFGKDIVRNPEIVYVKIISHDITLSEYGSSQYLGIDRPIDLNLSEVNDGIYDITSTINEGGIKYGEIKMGLSIAQFDGVFHDTQKWSVMIATLEVALVMIFSFFLGTYLTSQLRQLKIASQIISEKGPGYQVKVSGSDEIANFARSFNDMSLNLKESYDQLKQNLVIQEEVNKNLGISQKKSEEANQARKETMKKLALEIEIRTRAEDALQQSYAEIELRVENRTEELNKARLDYQNTASDLTQLMDTANAMILSIDRSGNINNWNQTATNLLGYAKKDVMGKNLLNMFIRDEDKAQVRIILDKALEGEI